jgi:hypothetical protein
MPDFITMAGNVTNSDEVLRRLICSLVMGGVPHPLDLHLILRQSRYAGKAPIMLNMRLYGGEWSAPRSVILPMRIQLQVSSLRAYQGTKRKTPSL